MKYHLTCYDEKCSFQQQYLLSPFDFTPRILFFILQFPHGTFVILSFFPSCHRITFTSCVAFVLTANRLDLDVKPKRLDFWPNRDIKWICRFTSFANFRPLFVHIIQFIADIISFFHWFSFVGKKLQNCVQRRQTVCVCVGHSVPIHLW